MLTIYFKKVVFILNWFWRLFRHSFLSLSVLFALWAMPVWADKLQSKSLIKVGFVGFDIGEYRQERFGQVGKIYHQLQSFPDNTPIHLIGHSHSKANFASKKLAAMRAEGARDKLINFGVADDLITVDYDVQNFVANDSLMHGVSVLVSSEIQSQSKINNQSRITSTDINNKSRLPDPRVQALAIEPSSNIEVEFDTDSCNLISIHSGSLHANLEREIAECGYVMGRWRFGSGDEVIDWNVPVPYSAIADDGIIGLLQLIEHNYQVRAHIHQLDQSIDFFPGIKNRGSYE